MFTMPFDLLLLFTVTSPIVGWLASRLHESRLAGAYAAVGLGASGIALYNLFQDVSKSNVIYLPSDGWFSAILRIDMLSIFMVSIFLGLGLAATIYSIIYVEKGPGTPFYYTLILTMISGMVGVVFAGDLFTLFVFWELMSVSTYALVAFYREEWASSEAGFKYLIMSAAGSATALFGMSLLYGMTGTLNFEGLASGFGSAAPNAWLYVAALFIFLGFGVKAAFVPLHTWLPDAYSSAPAPISAMLSGIVIGPGIYVIARTFFSAFISIQAQWLPIIAVLSFITMVLGNITALLQTDLKRMLAYSSIAQVGYMLVGLAVGTQTGLTGTFLQFFSHALMKGVAFLCAGAIIYRLGTKELSDMVGVGRKMPVTAIAFSISLFALIGIPPFIGFISELVLFTSAFQANLAWLGIALIVNSAISAAYYLRIVRTIMQIPVSEKVEKVKEIPLLMLIPICVLAISIIVFGIYPDLLVNFANQAAKALVSFGGLM